MYMLGAWTLVSLQLGMSLLFVVQPFLVQREGAD